MNIIFEKMSPPEYRDSPLQYFHENDIDHYPILVGESIKGKTFKSVEEWYSYPYKYEIMIEAMKFKDYLRKISQRKYLARFLNISHKELGRCSLITNTPILYEFRNDYIEYFIEDYECVVNGNPGYLGPKSLVNSELGKSILREMKNTKFSDLVFCHNYLCYKSFVVEDNKLIGIKNWQYAGFYPPEFEDIIHRYLEFI